MVIKGKSKRTNLGLFFTVVEDLKNSIEFENYIGLRLFNLKKNYLLQFFNFGGKIKAFKSFAFYLI